MADRTPLSTFYTPDAADAWPSAVAVVDAVGIGAQHALRRWEYAVALEAIRRWRGDRPLRDLRLVDIGGAGSRFKQMALQGGFVSDATVVDPSEANGSTLAEYLGSGVLLADVVTCISVLEHVDDLPHFLYHLTCLVRPGGLLVLTMDACGDKTERHDWPKDPYHFHWMRQRIFGPHQLFDLRYALAQLHCPPFEEPDYSAYPGPHVYNYSAAALVLQKHV